MIFVLITTNVAELDFTIISIIAQDQDPKFMCSRKTKQMANLGTVEVIFDFSLMLAIVMSQCQNQR